MRRVKPARKSTAPPPRKPAKTHDAPGKSSEAAREKLATSDVCVPLPMEVWRQVALHMSTRDLAKGLAQVCKAFRHLGTSAICLSSSNKAALEWTQKRWAGVSKLLLKPKNDPECTVLMSWACRHCQELGPLEQLGIVVNTSSTKETHSASCVAATVNILAHQAGHLTLLHLELWDIPFLPHMANLRHLIISTSGGRMSRYDDVNTTASMFACLQHLTALETLDLKLISSESDVQGRDLELQELKVLRKLRLVNIAVNALTVNPECDIAVQQWGSSALAASMSKNADLAIHSATWTLRSAISSTWPIFITSWAGLQKLDLQAAVLGGYEASSRCNLAAVAHIPVVRLKSSAGMQITMPKQTKWKHLWLECTGILDIQFEDVTTFGKNIVELHMTYSGFNGNKAGSDVLVSLNLLKQGLKRIKDTFDVKSKRKTLSARRTSSKSVARSVHNTCICGACGQCLREAGIMHDQFPGEQAAGKDTVPLLTQPVAAPAYYPPQCEYAAENGWDDDECDCDECIMRREDEDSEEDEYRNRYY